MLICDITAFLCNNCNCFSTFFTEFVKVLNNEIRTARATAITVTKKIEKKNEMIRKILVEIKRFIKKYVVLSLYYTFF